MAPGEPHPQPAAPGGGEPVATPMPRDGGPANPVPAPAGGKVRWIVLLGSALALVLGGVSAFLLWGGEQNLAVPGIYHGTGVVLAVLPAPSQLDAERDVVILQHDPIADLMDKKMTHPFLVQSRTLLRGIMPGTRVRFTLKDTPGALLLVRLEVIP